MAGILGFGGYVPERVMTNDDWSKIVDTTDEWITSRTGIKERRVAAEDESTADFACHAGSRAIADAGLSPDDIDEVIVATDTPEVYFPDTASFVQARLGLREVPAFDLGGSGCAGFVQALDVARARIALAPKNVLVIGVEVITRLIDWEDRAIAVLFGDGAGAVVIGPDKARAEVLDVVAGTDGTKAGILTLNAGGTHRPFNAETLASGEYKKLTMNGQEVFREAVRRMSQAVDEVLANVGKSKDEVALVIPHQANKRIIDAVRKKLKVDDSKVFVNVHEYGNTGSASVPLALSQAVGQGAISEGDLVVLTAFGAGFHWAAAALQF